MGNNDNNRQRGVVDSIFELIFGIVSLSFKLAFRIIETVFQVLFGVLSGIGSGSCKSHKMKSTDEAPAAHDIKKEPLKTGSTTGNVREFRKPDSSREEAESKAPQSSNKDFFIFLFILTIIPAIVALAMGKPLYAGIIGVSGFGLMLLAGIITGIVGSFRKRSGEQKVEEAKEETKDDDSVEKLIKDAFEKLFVIRKDIDKISDAEIKAKLEAICGTGEKIIGEVRTNPEGLTHVRKFFYYYLDAFAEIVKKYLRLSTFEESSEEISKLVTETERSFADIDGIFKDLCEKLLEKDMMHLKAEINVIKNSN